MWPKKFRFFHEFMEDLKTIFIFNTIKNFPEGLTYYDLKQFGDIPHSSIYRMMKDLEDNGDLIRKNGSSKETGRPKHLYLLSKQGETRLDELRTKIGEIFEFIKLRFPESDPDFDHEKFLNNATFAVWSSPVEFIKQQKIIDEEKIILLTEMEKDLTTLLEKVHSEKNRLKKTIQDKRESNI